MFESKSLLVTMMKWRISGQGYKHLTKFSRFVLFKSTASAMQKINLSAASVFVTEGLFMYIYFLLFEENHQNPISEMEKKILQRFRSFFRKMIAYFLKFSCAKRLKD